MRADAAPAHVWAAELGDVGSAITLGAEESRYVARVCRARVGETLTLTDGRGGLAHARIASADAQVRCVLERVERVSATRRAEMICGAPEGERADWLVEKLAELGVSVFQPVDCARASWRRAEERAERWRRLARAALVQSRGRFEMEIRAPLALSDGLSAGGELRHLADPAGTPVHQIRRCGAGMARVLVGPSAGLEAGEIAGARSAGFEPISLSSNRLRTETAALAWAAWWASPGF